MVEKVLRSPSDSTSLIFEQTLTIDQIATQSIDLKMSEPLVLSFGTFTHRPSGWVGLGMHVNGTESSGFGEGTTLPQPLFTDDSGETIAAAMNELAQYSAEQPTVGAAIETVQTHQFADGRRFPTARLAIEMALLDGATKANGISMADFIGLSEEISSVPYGKSIGGNSRESILQQVETSLELKARKIKLKISPASFDMVSGAIKDIQVSHPEVELMVDANGGFDPLDPEHIRMLSELDTMRLLMIEEPVSRVGEVRGLEAVKALRNTLPRLQTPICLDDCLATLDDCRRALEENLADIINIKPGRIGSFLESLKLADIARQYGKQVMVGGMIEATPGRYMTTLLGAFCLSQGFTIPGDLSLAQERMEEDLVGPEKWLQLDTSGNIIVPRGQGWGFSS